MSNKPLAFRLGLYISIAVLLVYTALILWSYRFNYSLVKQEAESKMLLLNSRIIGSVREKIVSTQEVASNIAIQIPFYKKHGEISNFLLPLLNKYRHIEAIRIKIFSWNGKREEVNYTAIRKDSVSIIINQDDISPECFDEEWLLRQYSGKRKPGWSDPFKCEARGIIVSTYFQPFESDDADEKKTVSGYIACDLSLNFVQQIIRETKIGKMGFAFLVSDKGVYLTHPVKEYILNKTLFNLPREVYHSDSASMAKFLETGSEPMVVYPARNSRTKSWAYPSKILENNWVMALVIPFSELYQGLNALMIKMVLFSIIVVISIFFLVFFISNRILYPLRKISRELHSFINERSGSFSKIHNETTALKQSLLRLQNRYEDYVQRENEINLKNNRFRETLQLASEIQQSIIPPQGTHVMHEANIIVHSVFLPAQVVSGDLYDFFMIDDHRLLLTIGDVSGGGVPAAIFMGIAHTFIKSSTSFESVKDIVDQVNKVLCKRNTSQFFLTLFIAILDTRQRILNYCNAGHTPTFLLSSGAKVTELGDPHGLPLGLYAERYYKDSTVHIKKDDTLILYTDGITEQMNEAGEFFGVDSFYNLFSQFKDKTPAEIASIIVQNVDDFAEGAARIDDLSLLVIKCY
jgi:phosphoserine phosphatase RsbU/P